MNMESLAIILEQELAGAFQVADEKSLHRYVTILTESLAREDRNERSHSEFREAILRIDTRMEEGFKRMDERFEAMQNQMDRRFEALQLQLDKRFEAVDKR